MSLPDFTPARGRGALDDIAEVRELTGKTPYTHMCMHRLSNAVVTCEIKLFQNYSSLRRCPTEIILFQRVETCPKLFQKFVAAHEYFPTCSMSPK